MPRERFHNLDPAVRTRLLDLAIHEFAARGLERASLNGILADAGLSKGSYYYYFDDKEDLFLTAIEHALDAATRALPLPDFEAIAPADFWPATERSVAAWVAHAEAPSDLLRAVRHASDAQKRGPRFAAVLARSHAFWHGLVRAGQRLGCVRTDVPGEVLVGLVAAADQALDAAYFARHERPTRRALERHVRLVFDTVRRLLAVDPGSTKAPRARARARSRRR